MQSDFNDTRRSFLTKIAKFGAAAGAAGLSTLPAFGVEPQNCSGPQPPATPIKWTPDTNPILPRVAASTLSGSNLTKLANAYKALRNLASTDPSDPRGWMQQGDKHCWNCGGGLDGQTGEEIHGSWLFLPWHRAFLYFHERILGALINDNSVRLAYWDWDNPAHRAIPSAFATPANASNPLWDSNRSAKAGNQLPTSLIGPRIINPITGAATFATFGGTSSAAGNLENGPHGGVHIWCGDTSLKASNASMGLLDTAAQDPIFFAHHANIDRLWSVWLNSSPSHQNPTDPNWLSHSFTFWDEKKRWVSITVADVINMSNSLRYTYSGAATSHVTFATPTVRQLTVNPQKTITLPDDVIKRVKQAGNTPRMTTLRVESITLPPGARGIYRIIANNTGGGAAGPKAVGTSNDLGYIAIVPKTSKDTGRNMQMAMNVDLDVTEQLPSIVQQGGKLNLSVTPMAAPGQSTQFSYQSVYLLER